MMGILKKFIAPLLGLLILSGCQTAPPPHLSIAQDPRFVDLDAAIASADSHPMVVLVGEFGANAKDDAIRDLLSQSYIRAHCDGYKLMTIDLSCSANRAQAARFHPVETPVLIYLSPKGLIVNREVGASVGLKDTIALLAGLTTAAAELDEKFEQISAGTNGVTANMRIGDFLMARHNDREAIPYFAKVVSSPDAGVNDRVHASVETARAHLWIGEPEKARHEAKDLIAAMGRDSRDALSGGYFVLGLQDATAKRFSLARREFGSAVLAAAELDYGKQAAAELAKLPKDTQ